MLWCVPTPQVGCVALAWHGKCCMQGARPAGEGCFFEAVLSGSIWFRVVVLTGGRDVCADCLRPGGGHSLAWAGRRHSQLDWQVLLMSLLYYEGCGGSSCYIWAWVPVLAVPV